MKTIIAVEYGYQKTTCEFAGKNRVRDTKAFVRRRMTETTKHPTQ